METQEEKAASLQEREEILRLLHDSLEARNRSLEARYAAREAALLERERQNEDLRLANQKLVMATLAAQELREAAQMARRRQDEFLAMLAHELRNPLAPISVAVELLARLDGKPVPGKLLDVVRRQIKHLVRLVDDLLDVSRVTAGKVVLQRRITAVQDFVQQAIETCRDDVEKRRHRLLVDVPSDPVTVDGDPVRLTQVIVNLIQNASAYTPDGGEIRVAVGIEGPAVEIRVGDNGAGIAPAAMPYIFDLFVQDERPLSRTQGGLGVGLTIVRRMVEMHGGTVQASSAGRGQGSEFTVHLPMAGRPRRTAVNSPAVAVALAPLRARILIVEDNVDAGDVLAELLRVSGHDVHVALDGPGGLDQFERLQPHVVLCDIGLPGLDGYEVVARMRQSRHEPRPALIALTGYGSAGDVERALVAGFDRHLVKPVNPDAIVRLVDEAMRTEDWISSEHGLMTGHGSLRENDRGGSSNRPPPLAPA